MFIGWFDWWFIGYRASKVSLESAAILPGAIQHLLKLALLHGICILFVQVLDKLELIFIILLLLLLFSSHHVLLRASVV